MWTLGARKRPQDRGQRECFHCFLWTLNSCFCYPLVVPCTFSLLSSSCPSPIWLPTVVWIWLCSLPTPSDLCLFFPLRVTETHQLAELNEKKNERLRAAFGISDSYVDGSSFDPQRRAREAKQPAPEPPKPYRYSRPRNTCQLLFSILSTLCLYLWVFCFFFFCSLWGLLNSFLSDCLDFVVLKLKCLRFVLTLTLPLTIFLQALSGSPAVLAHQPQSKRRKKRRKIEDGKLVGKLL